jgi:hypothetical protein
MGQGHGGRADRFRHTHRCVHECLPIMRQPSYRVEGGCVVPVVHMRVTRYTWREMGRAGATTTNAQPSTLHCRTKAEFGEGGVRGGCGGRHDHHRPHAEAWFLPRDGRPNPSEAHCWPHWPHTDAVHGPKREAGHLQGTSQAMMAHNTSS